MNDDLFDGIDDLASVPQHRPQSSQAHRQVSPAARQAVSKRRKPSPDRYRSQGMPIPTQHQPVSPNRRKAPKPNTMSAEAQMLQREKTRPKANASIFRRAWFFLRSNPPSEIGLAFLGWVSRHVYVIFLVAVMFIVAGMMLSRYISVAGALLLVLLGALLSNKDYDTAGYCCYGAAFMDFILPYLI